MSGVETVSGTLTAFLLERIAEDEQAARLHQDAPPTAALQGSPVVWWQRLAARAPAECEAKLRIVAEHPDYGGYGESCQTCAESGIDQARWPCPTLRALAAVYADHAEFRDEWRP